MSRVSIAMKIAHTEEEIERAGAGKDEQKLRRSSVSGAAEAGGADIQALCKKAEKEVEKLESTMGATTKLKTRLTHSPQQPRLLCSTAFCSHPRFES